jgi:hypothetical protein
MDIGAGVSFSRCDVCGWWCAGRLEGRVNLAEAVMPT